MADVEGGPAMKYLPLLCELHGWVLVNGEVVSDDQPQMIECEGHVISKDVRGIVPLEITEPVSKTRSLSDKELDALLKIRQRASA